MIIFKGIKAHLKDNGISPVLISIEHIHAPFGVFDQGAQQSFGADGPRVGDVESEPEVCAYPGVARQKGFEKGFEMVYRQEGFCYNTSVVKGLSSDIISNGVIN